MLSRRAGRIQTGHFLQNGITSPIAIARSPVLVLVLSLPLARAHTTCRPDFPQRDREDGLAGVAFSFAAAHLFAAFEQLMASRTTEDGSRGPAVGRFGGRERDREDVLALSALTARAQELGRACQQLFALRTRNVDERIAGRCGSSLAAARAPSRADLGNLLYVLASWALRSLADAAVGRAQSSRATLAGEFDGHRRASDCKGGSWIRLTRAGCTCANFTVRASNPAGQCSFDDHSFPRALLVL